MNFILIILYVVVSIFVLVVYAIKDDLSEVYKAFIPLAITGIACFILNNSKEKDTKEEI